jgi:hypothetical protein
MKGTYFSLKSTLAQSQKEKEKEKEKRWWTKV